MNPLISLCIASYNNSLYIERMIKTALQQTYENLEIIIVDDGSTDITSTILKKYKSEKKVYVFQKENGGLSSSRQFALEKANGEYICFVDADDFLSSDYIINMYQCINSNRADICVCGTVFVDENEKQMNQFPSEFTMKEKTSLKLNASDVNNNYNILISRYCMSDSWNKMYKMSFIKNNNITFNMPKGLNGTDLIFNHKIMLYCPKICTITSNEYFHVIYKKSAVHRYNKKLYQSYLITVEEILNLAKKIPLIDINAQLKLVYLNFIRNSLDDLYRDSKILKIGKLEINNVFAQSYDYYFKNFSNTKTTSTSKSLTAFDHILKMQNKKLLYLYLYIRNTLKKCKD